MQLIMYFEFQCESLRNAPFGGIVPLIHSYFLCGEHGFFCLQTSFNHNTGLLAESPVFFPGWWAWLLLSVSALYLDRSSHREVPLVNFHYHPFVEGGKTRLQLWLCVLSVCGYLSRQTCMVVLATWKLNWWQTHGWDMLFPKSRFLNFRLLFAWALNKWCLQKIR